MKQIVMALALSTLCLAISACDPKRIAEAVPIPPARMSCTALAGTDGRPVIAPEQAIDWTRIASVDQARQEHDAFVVRLRARESAIAAYIVRLEGRVFACANDAAWLREYSASLSAP